MARTITRYAIFYAPATESPLARFAASWLGWDPARGAEVARHGVPEIPGEITAAPRRYGFHGTLKAPFRPADGAGTAGLVAALDAFAETRPPARANGLRLARLGGFLALIPEGDSAEIDALAAAVVAGFDRFRAPLSAADRARRNAAALSPRKVALLERWGYPYVMEEFRFHLTLTGDLSSACAASVETVLAPLLAPLLPEPFVIDTLALFGEAEDGRFHILHRAALSG